MTEKTTEQKLADALASVAALETKNAELIREKQAEKTKREETETRLTALETTAKEAKDAKDAAEAKAKGDWDAREAQLKAAHKTEIDAKNAEIAKLNGARDKLVLDNGLSSHLDEAGVPAELKPAVQAMLRSQHKGAVEIDGDGNFVAKIGDKPLKDFITEWAKSDAAKPFIKSDNSGGGSPGGKGGTQITGNPYDKAKPNYTQQAQLEKSDPARAAQLRAAAA